MISRKLWVHGHGQERDRWCLGDGLSERIKNVEEAERLLLSEAHRIQSFFKDDCGEDSSASSLMSLATLSSVDGWVSIREQSIFFLNFPKGLTIHRLAELESLNVLQRAGEGHRPSRDLNRQIDLETGVHIHVRMIPF